MLKGRSHALSVDTVSVDTLGVRFVYQVPDLRMLEEVQSRQHVTGLCEYHYPSPFT
jgi:hypothetical protein